MNKKRFIPATVLFVLAVSLFAAAQTRLALTEKIVAMKYPVPNMTHGELEEKLASREAGRYLLFDTRAEDEYRVSHIASAEHVSPEMSADAFMAKYGDRLAGKRLVFYCSVGYRSSIFAERVLERARAAGADSVSNLRGGIFRWYIEGNPVVDEKGVTDEVHPYDKVWGALLAPKTPSGPEQ